jgi:hypothetical protein
VEKITEPTTTPQAFETSAFSVFPSKPDFDNVQTVSHPQPNLTIFSVIAETTQSIKPKQIPVSSIVQSQMSKPPHQINNNNNQKHQDQIVSKHVSGPPSSTLVGDTTGVILIGKIFLFHIQRFSL